MVRAFGFLIVGCSLTLFGDLQSSTVTKPDPLLGDRIVRALVFQGRLFLQGAPRTRTGPSQVLVSLDVGSGYKQVHFSKGVIAIEPAGNGLWVLHRAPSGSSLLIAELRDGKFEDRYSFTPSSSDVPFALLDLGDAPAILSARTLRIFSADGHLSRSVKLQGKFRNGVQVSTAAPAQADYIYVGFNVGEWGGGLQRVDLKTGSINSVERRDTNKLCAGPLNGDCDPVTGVIPDSTKPGCVLASVGLVHMGMSDGRILRVCGNNVSVVWQKASKGGFDGTLNVTEAVFGLAKAPDGGFWAITDGALHRFAPDGTPKNEYPLPKLERVSGIYLSRDVPGAIVVLTDVNWAVSTSGYTPLLAPLDK